MPKHKATPRNIVKVLARIQVRSANDKEEARFWADAVNQICDSAGDFFGTEGQNDPRGDQRE